MIVDNVLTGNRPDEDVPGDDEPTGISVFSAVVPIAQTTVANNRIADEQFGIYAFNALKLSGLPSNKFAGSVAVPVTVD